MPATELLESMAPSDMLQSGGHPAPTRPPRWPRGPEVKASNGSGLAIERYGGTGVSGAATAAVKMGEPFIGRAVPRMSKSVRYVKKRRQNRKRRATEKLCK